MNVGLNSESLARLATLGELRDNILPNLIRPVPPPETLRALLDRARIPRFKSNPLARRGGGRCYYSVAAVEKLFRLRLTKGGGVA